MWTKYDNYRAKIRKKRGARESGSLLPWNPILTLCVLPITEEEDERSRSSVELRLALSGLGR